MTIIRTAIAAIVSAVAILLTLPVVVIGLPFWIVAFLTRFVHARASSISSRVVPWKEIIEYEPTVGWKPKPNLDVYAYADKVFHLTTDDHGWRGQTTLTDSDIVVFGDSCAFGYGVSDKSFFGELNSKVRIKAIGAGGYNMVHTLIWMRQLSAELNGKLVVWFIYFGNDLYDNLQPSYRHYRSPFVRTVNGTGSWEIVTSHIRPTRWIGSSQRDYYAKLAEICSPTVLSQRACSACEFLIAEGSEICNRAGARLVVMTIPDVTQISASHMQKLTKLARDPDRFDPTLPDTRIAEICDKLSVPVVALKDHLGVEDYKQHDVHWNEKGHKRVAEILSDLHREYTLKQSGMEFRAAPRPADTASTRAAAAGEPYAS